MTDNNIQSKYNVLSIDSALSSLHHTDDTYLYWLANNDFPPKSYLKHPLNSEKALNEYKNFFKENFKISLGAFIRLKRVFFILNNTSDYEKNELHYSFIETPLGLMLSIFSPKGLCLLEFLDRKMLESEINELVNRFQSNLTYKETELSLNLAAQLQKYFQKSLKKFSIPLDLIGTDFQKQVWEELLKIEYGKTISYSEQATNLNIPNATRAVASANGKNKISIIIPCHRVCKKDNTLGGYGGGIYRKKYLIELEK